jgi:hypothetical protein
MLHPVGSRMEEGVAIAAEEVTEMLVEDEIEDDVEGAEELIEDDNEVVDDIWLDVASEDELEVVEDAVE